MVFTYSKNPFFFVLHLIEDDFKKTVAHGVVIVTTAYLHSAQSKCVAGLPR